MPRHTATLCFATTLGLVEVESAHSGVTRVRLGSRGRPRDVGEGAALDCARQAREQIVAYLEGALRQFTVPVDVVGTAFQQAVWKRLLRIPYGATRSYGQIAAELGKLRAARAVGMACRANPVPILVPCHRVVSGDRRGQRATGLAEIKRRLLELEREQNGQAPH